MNHRRRKILQLMDLCQREFLHQVDLLSPSRTGVTEAEYWAQRRLNEKKQEIEKEGFTPNPTKFQTQKQLIRDAVAVAREKAISYEDFQDILQDEYNIFVKTQRGRYSYLPPERNKFISERSLGESCKRECLKGFFIQNAERNLRYKEDPILIFTTRTRLRLVVDLQENVKAQENLAYEIRSCMETRVGGQSPRKGKAGAGSTGTARASTETQEAQP